MKDPLRTNICIISQYWRPDVAGDAVRLGNTIRALNALGRNVTLITTYPHYPSGGRRRHLVKFIGVQREDGITVVRLAMPPIPHSGFGRRLVLYAWFSVAAVLPTIFFGRCAYVWAFSPKVFSTYVAVLAKLHRGAKVISDVTDVWAEALVNTGYVKEDSLLYAVASLTAKIAYRISDKITTLTPQMARIFQLHYGVAKQKITLVPNVARPSLRTQGKSIVPLTILYYGNLGTNYDFRPLLQAAHQLRSEKVRFVIKGNGELLHQILNEITELRLKNVKVYTETMTDEDLMSLVQSADALVLPMGRHRYPDASFPIKFVEYLWAGKPIIYIGNGYPAFLVKKHRLGLATQSGEIKDIVRFVKHLLEDGDPVSEMGSRARHLAVQLFSEDRLTEILKETFG
jgi:glycosyltransferase involved in cell wall biosynthesis